MGTTPPAAADTRQFSGKRYLVLGLVLVFLGPILYMVQIGAKVLRTPWYLPILATAGVALLLLAVVQRRNAWRFLALILCALLTGGEWYFLVAKSKVPAYDGPAVTGTSFPPFATTLADGTPFSQDNLRGEQNTAMVFFRGRW